MPPGRPFNAPGASLVDDYVVYALDASPSGVRLLSLHTGADPQPGTRVRILGVPDSMPQDEDDLFGSIEEVTSERISVDLDVPYDLRGWGGAPVVDANSDAVLGMLQAYFPRGSTSRVIASPIATRCASRSTVARAGASPTSEHPSPCAARRGRPRARLARSGGSTRSATAR